MTTPGRSVPSIAAAVAAAMSTAKNSAEDGFPQLPSEDLFAHAATAHLEKAAAALAAMGLNYVAAIQGPQWLDCFWGIASTKSDAVAAMQKPIGSV